MKCYNFTVILIVLLDHSFQWDSCTVTVRYFYEQLPHEMSQKVKFCNIHEKERNLCANKKSGQSLV